jgi:hypothetical protein
VGHRRHKRRNKKSFWNSMRMNLSEPMGHSKGSLRGKFIIMNAYIKNTETSQISDLMLYLKLLEKQEAVNPKLAEGQK